MGFIVGVDLGTTTSIASVWRNNRVEVIPNTQGNRITPSYVAFNDTERLIGDAAKNQATLNPANTVYDAKRLIGRKFSDPVVQADMKLWPFKVIDDGNDRPQIVVNFKNQERKFYAEEISAMILGYMRDISEAYLGEPVKDMVITVPAYFNDAARQATKDAAVIAGINPIRIINEPTAAAVAYGLDQTDQTNEDKNILIFDLGGGTFDVTVCVVDGGLFEVKSTVGDPHLGGEDFDNALLKHFTQEFKRKYKKDLQNSNKALKRLKVEAEKVKRVLSTCSSDTLSLDSLYENIDFSATITRARFEELCGQLFSKCIDSVEKALYDSGFSKSMIHDIVLVGGSSRIPKIQQLLSSFFNDKELCKSINPDECVSYGAAVMGAILNGSKDEQITNVLLLDVCPLSVSIKTNGKIASVMIPRNTTIPTKKTQIFSTYHDNQTEVSIEICEGERPMFDDNHFLGKFVLSGIPPAVRGTPKIEVTLDIDANGVLQITAEEQSQKSKSSLVIENHDNKLSKEDIEKLIKEAEQFKLEDLNNKEKIEARNDLETYAHYVKQYIKNNFTGKKFAKIGQKADDIMAWLADDQNRDLDEINAKKEELSDMFEPIIAHMYGAERPKD